MRILIDSVGDNYGSVGTKTNLIDYNGNRLCVGDIVKWESKNNPKHEGYSFIVDRPGFYNNYKQHYFFLMGWQMDWNSEGVKNTVEVNLYKKFSDVETGEICGRIKIINCWEE